MRWPFVAQHHASATVLLPVCFPFQQKLNAARQKRDLLVLTGNHVGHLLDHAGQVGDLFFEFFHVA